MTLAVPPAFAWDWLARQRLPWREVHRRLVADRAWVGAVRYAALDARSEVMALVSADYAVDAHVRRVVDDVVRELVFLGRTDVALADRGVSAPPRGLRWWWEHLGGGADLEGERAPAPERAATQLALGLASPPRDRDDVLGGYGDRPLVAGTRPTQPSLGVEPGAAPGATAASEPGREVVA